MANNVNRRSRSIDTYIYIRFTLPRRSGIDWKENDEKGIILIRNTEYDRNDDDAEMMMAIALGESTIAPRAS
jgi:hypothetical protein